MKIDKFQSVRIAVMLGSLWFFAVILFAGIYTPEYSHSSQAISELAAPGTPYAGLVRFGGFIPLGLIFILLALVVWRNPNIKRSQRLLLILFALTGLALIFAGIFPTDIHGRRNSFSGMAHAVAGLVLLILVSVTPFIAAFAFPWRGNKRYGFKFFSLFSSCVLILLFALLPNGISPAWIQLQKIVLGDWFTIWYRYQGLDQRVLFSVYFCWLFAFVGLGIGSQENEDLCS